MDKEAFELAYETGHSNTERFLTSRGVPYEDARDTAQAAWTRGWEQLSQLRDPKFLLTWINRIALNIYRTQLRREHGDRVALTDRLGPHPMYDKMIDIDHMLATMKEGDAIVLYQHYIEGKKIVKSA